MLGRPLSRTLLASLAFAALATAEDAAPVTIAVPGSATAAPSVRAKASYYIGLQMGSSIKTYDMDADEVIKAIKAQVAGTAVEPSQEEKMQVMQAFEQEVTARASEKSKHMLDDKMKEGYQKTASGLLYKVVKASDKADGKKPTAQDKVDVLYKGTFPDGKEFDSTDKHGGQPANFQVGQVVPGWTEGLQLMKEGDKFHFVIPPELGYGQRGSPPTIPPNSVLEFDVELLTVTQATAPAAPPVPKP